MATARQIKAAVISLDAMTGGDPEIAHMISDKILEEFAPAEVVAARDRLIERCAWWACA